MIWQRTPNPFCILWYHLILIGWWYQTPSWRQCTVGQEEAGQQPWTPCSLLNALPLDTQVSALHWVDKLSMGSVSSEPSLLFCLFPFTGGVCPLNIALNHYLLMLSEHQMMLPRQRESPKCIPRSKYTEASDHKPSLHYRSTYPAVSTDIHVLILARDWWHFEF